MTRLDDILESISFSIDDVPGNNEKAIVWALAKSLSSLLEVEPMLNEERCFYCEGEVIIYTDLKWCGRCKTNPHKDYVSRDVFEHADDCVWQRAKEEWA